MGGIDDHIIDQIEHSLRNYNLRDIKKISQIDTVLASFTLCSCFIEQMSGFRYANVKHKTGRIMFENFVRDYLGMYDAEKLRNDLRNKLVHNYSLGDTYSLTMGAPNDHLQIDKYGRLILNLENFISDLENAFNSWISELRTDNEIRSNALIWYEQYKILG